MRRLLASALVALFVCVTGTALAHPQHHSQHYWDRQYGHRQHLKALERIQDRQEAQARQLQGRDTALVECIIGAENAAPGQTNSSGHMGIGQWDEPTWIGDGGRRFAPTPLGATYAQQKQVIEEQVAAGNAYGHWTEWEGGKCWPACRIAFRCVEARQHALDEAERLCGVLLDCSVYLSTFEGVSLGELSLRGHELAGGRSRIKRLRALFRRGSPSDAGVMFTGSIRPEDRHDAGGAGQQG